MNRNPFLVHYLTLVNTLYLVMLQELVTAHNCWLKMKLCFKIKKNRIYISQWHFWVAWRLG